MKTMSRVLVASLALVVLLLPLAALTDGLPSPVEKKIPPGITVVSYAGQNLRFDTPVALVIKLEPLAIDRIKLTVNPYGGGGGGQQSNATLDLEIFWENYGSTIYDGPVPDSSAWEGVLYTESGFTEK